MSSRNEPRGLPVRTSSCQLRGLFPGKKANNSTGVGVSESGAEFGEDNIPGKLDKDYAWPNTTTIQTLRDAGMNIFRVPFLMERLVPDDMTSSPDSTYMKGLKSVSICLSLCGILEGSVTDGWMMVL